MPHVNDHLPVKFDDGTAYCDAGREITRRLFSWYHKDDGSYCAQYSLEIKNLPVAHNIPGCQCSVINPPKVCPRDCEPAWQDWLQSTFEDSAPARVGVKGMLEMWTAAKEYAKANGITHQDDLRGFPFSEGWE